MAILRITAIQISVRAAVSAGLAYWIAVLLSAHHAIYALVGAIIVTDLNPATSRRLAIQRMAGTVIGAVSGAVFVQVLPNRPLALAVAILVSMSFVFVCRFETSAARVAGYVAAIVMSTHGDDAWLYAFDRAWETLLGIGTALVVGLVPLWLRNIDADREAK